MQCSGCQAENPESANFCNACGARLRPRGEPASAERALRDYTPKHLAEKILTLRSSLEGERKTVTALFADIQGSMDLAEQVDPEEWHAVMDRFFRILGAGIHRYEGTINQFTGDGIMALFGAPIAHEDHALRACHAALDLLAELSRYADELKRTQGLRFSVRMGMNSGDVVVGRIGDDLRMDYTAQGHSVGLAARIEKLASPFAAYLSESTARSVEGYFALANLGRFDLKGVREPVGVFELLGRGPIRTRLERARSRGLTAFVSRGDQVRLLDEALTDARAGTGSIVCIEGEAGVGKSRLAWEFAVSCREAGVRVFEAQCASHGRVAPFLPLRGLLEAVAGVEPGDSDEQVRERLAGRLLRLSPDLGTSLPAIYEILGVPERAQAPEPGGESQQRHVTRVLRQVLASGQDDNPTLFVFEDLQWADDATQAVLAELVESLRDLRALLIVNFRPEYRPVFRRHAGVRWIALSPLPGRAVSAMLDDLVGGDASLATVRETIEARSGGNPFFVEELVQSLVETGALEGAPGGYRRGREAAGGTSLPSSVRTLLAARIDRLPEAEKEILQTAAVIGRNFDEALLRAVLGGSQELVGEGLASLEEAGFVVVEERIADVRYAFRHPLTYEVAYGALLGTTRARLHEVVAGLIESQAGDRAEREAALLAHHYEQAGEALAAARWHSAAAASAAQIDVQGALTHYERVRSLTEGSRNEEGKHLRLQACLGALEVSGRLGLSLAQAGELFDEGLAIAESRDDTSARARLHSALAARLGWSGDPVRQRRHLGEAVRLAKDLPDLEVNLTVLQRAYVSEFHAGALQAGLAHAQEGLLRAERGQAAGRSDRTARLYRVLLLSSANVLTQLGHLKEAEAMLARASKLADPAAGHTLALVTANLSNYRGRRVECLRDAQALVVLAARTGSSWADPVAHSTLGRALLTNADWSGAREAFDYALRRAREEQLGLESEPVYLAGLAEACAGCGELDRAHRLAGEAVAAAERAGARFWAVEARIARARVLLAKDGAREAAAIDQALGIAEEGIEETGGEVMRPVVAELRSELADASGDARQAVRLRRLAMSGYRTLAADGHEARLVALLESDTLS